jgi:alkanesulfonate monooxygenase SsuD/methylene tetrahydromethanopterin reductase-like flavin-dependent oxidoreductase (luciferase family)
MTNFGYTLMTEQSGPKDLVRYAVPAEERGFDFEVCSDHFSPWLTSQGHAPNAWAVLGAVAQATDHVDLYTYVTCPTMRYPPAIVAQQAATVQILADGRFTLGLGSGENLNEHVVGKGWPAVERRQDMLPRAGIRPGPDRSPRRPCRGIRPVHGGDLHLRAQQGVSVVRHQPPTVPLHLSGSGGAQAT